MMETKWYVITGAPSSGKTTLTNRLAFEGYPIVPDAARILIDEERSQGLTVKETRANDAAFQRRILKMKMEIEEKTNPLQLTFFDRGIPDSIAYYRNCGEDPGEAIEASSKRRYKGVFLLEHLPFEKDYARIEDEKKASELEQLAYDAYAETGYNVIYVPRMPVGKRMQLILSRL